MPIKAIGSDEEFKTVMEANKDNIVLVDFYATWCGPCKMIAPQLERLSEEHKDVVFLKVDVDDCADSAEENGVSAMPTIILFKNGVKVDEVVGANVEKIEKALTSLK